MQLKIEILKGLLIMAALFIFLSCNRTKQSTNPTVPAYDTEEFKVFYERFSKDSVFQMEHIVFPLEGMKAPVDSLDLPSDSFRWNMNEWKLQKEYDDFEGTFSREFLDIGGLVIERISDTSGKFTMERRFGRLSTGWHLIYYREMGMY